MTEQEELKRIKERSERVHRLLEEATVCINEIELRINKMQRENGKTAP